MFIGINRRRLLLGAAALPLLGGLSGPTFAASVAELSEDLRMAEVRLRVARDRYARGQIPLSNVQAREREVQAARSALQAAQNGGGTSTAQASSDNTTKQNSTGREQYVSTAGQLDNAIRSAGPGSRIILNAGSYGQSSDFLVRASGNSSRPLVIEARPGARVTLTRDMVVYGAHVQIVGLTFDRARITVFGANCRVSRCTFNSPAILARGARDIEIDRNHISGFSSRAIDIDPSYDGRIGSNPYIHHNYLFNSNGNADYGIGVGHQPSHTNLKINARIEFNLIENCNIDQCILIKCSNNKIHNNTILNGGAIINRHGKGNSYFGNFVRGTKGLWIMDVDNTAEENRLEDSQILVIAGDLTSSELQKQLGGYPRAENTQLRNNFSTRTTVGRVFSGSGRRLPALNTTINGHRGRIDLATQQNTRSSNLNSSSAGGRARQTSRNQVGPNS